MNETQIKLLVERFLAWPVPASCYPDGTPGIPGRTGTNLLSYAEAKEMLEHVLATPPGGAGGDVVASCLNRIENSWVCNACASGDEWQCERNTRPAAEQVEANPDHLGSGASGGVQGPTDADRLDWLQRQDLNDTVFGYVIDAPRDGEYCINAGSGPFYGKTLRKALDAAILSSTVGRVE